MHAQHTLPRGFKHRAPCNLGPTNDEEPIKIRGSDPLYGIRIVDIPDLLNRDAVLAAEVVDVNTARLLRRDVIMKGYDQVEMAANIINFLHAREPELHARN